VAVTVAASALGASPRIGVIKVKIKVAAMVSEMFAFRGGNRFTRSLITLRPFWVRFNLGALGWNVLMAFTWIMAPAPIKP